MKTSSQPARETTDSWATYLHRSSRTEAAHCWHQWPWWRPYSSCWKLSDKSHEWTWIKNWFLSTYRCVTYYSMWATWVLDFDSEVINLLVSTLERAQRLNSSRSSVDGERWAVWILDGVRQQGVQCPFFISVMGLQLSYLAAWNQKSKNVRSNYVTVFLYLPEVSWVCKEYSLSDCRRLWCRIGQNTYFETRSRRIAQKYKNSKCYVI